MEDLVFLKYLQLIVFTGFIISAVLLVINIIKEKYNQDK